MSYAYARIPIKAGLNIVCGPNGAGKSSILLAISVALGQAYTERSRKLSDLIRWGKDTARVTIVFDNTPKSKKRPVPRFEVDYFRLSRYLKKDGSYWFEANFRTVNKSDIINILDEFGINPDNMLIIMHQHMMEEFGVITPKQKLMLVEEAVGLIEYRRNLLQAQETLSQALSEEESVKNLLENAGQTLDYWKGEYNKYQKRKELIRKKESLGMELILSRLNRQKETVDGWKKRVRKGEDQKTQLEREIEKNKEAINTLKETLNMLHYEQRKSFYSLLTLEKEKTEYEVMMKLHEKTLIKISALNKALSLENALKKQMKNLESYISEINFENIVSRKRLDDVEKKIHVIQSELVKFDERIDLTTKNYLDSRVREGILGFQKVKIEDEIRSLNRELRAAQNELEELKLLVERVDVRLKTKRKPQKISEEIKITNVQLMALDEVSEDVEKMFLTYLNLFNELKEKSVIVSENRKKTLREIEDRKQTWLKLVHSLLDKVSVTYQRFLSKIEATGKIRLINAADIETAGLELIVGFKGAELAILDAYTQSGGERSVATMAFLLALQQHVKSTFRAVDEFDVHMDPRNREVISNLLFMEIEKNQENQYLTITPGQITSINENVHVITVQNVEGKSEISLVA
jgi:chromosome segregation protein